MIKEVKGENDSFKSDEEEEKPKVKSQTLPGNTESKAGPSTKEEEAHKEEKK